MNKIIFFILGVVVGGTLVWLVVKMTERKKKETLIQRQAREKETNKSCFRSFRNSGKTYK